MTGLDLGGHTGICPCRHMMRSMSESTPSATPRRLRPRRTKIIATIGPASNAPEIIEEMIRVGMNVARFNLSHGSFPEHAERIRRVRAAAAQAGAFTAILVDTKGSEIRTGALRGGEARNVETVISAPRVS